MKPSKDLLKDFIIETINISKLQEMTELISKAKELGLQSDVYLAYENLIAACPPFCEVGPIHGDLNTRNVMVHGNDAVLIDFYSVKTPYPMTADPAALDISLSFEFEEKEDTPSFHEWQKFIDEAYAPEQILKPLGHSSDSSDKFHWLRRSLRELRHILIGCDCREQEIQVMIACYLMRIARLSPAAGKDVKEKFIFDCRAYALVVAEKIADHLRSSRLP